MFICSLSHSSIVLVLCNSEIFSAQARPGKGISVDYAIIPMPVSRHAITAIKANTAKEMFNILELIEADSRLRADAEFAGG